jgi:hypothetical protein
MKYLGAKSLDAEIHIDFLKSEVTMDYSSNAFHSSYESSHSSRRDNTNEWLNLPIWKRLLETIVIFPMERVSIPILIVAMPICTTLSKFHLFPKWLNYPYQNYLRWHLANFVGVYEEVFEGEMSGTVLMVPIDKNIWCSYELEGDYENYIKAIHFERRLRVFRKYDKFPLFKQDGWVLTFEFTQKPVFGKCVVKSV